MLFRSVGLPLARPLSFFSTACRAWSTKSTETFVSASSSKISRACPPSPSQPSLAVRPSTRRSHLPLLARTTPITWSEVFCTLQMEYPDTFASLWRTAGPRDGGGAGEARPALDAEGRSGHEVCCRHRIRKASCCGRKVQVSFASSCGRVALKAWLARLY